MATSVPGGRCDANKYTMENLPHVAGKSWELMKELMEGLEKEDLGFSGWEKFWTNLNLPGCPSLGIIDKGDDWKGPMDS